MVDTTCKIPIHCADLWVEYGGGGETGSVVTRPRLNPTSAFYHVSDLGQ